ncbi:MAG: response regulator transcription factor [Flavipsychrobacter sp.]|nr:response regulator transcription factor [Flavipsychrobacter sp.]
MLQEFITVAYADDHALVRNGISSILNNIGGIKVVIQARHGIELISKIQNASELPDICLLDINMPEMDGFETILNLKKNWPQMKILVLTVFDSDLYITRMIRYGASGYLLKSSDPEELKAALISAYKSGYYYADANTNELMEQVKNKEIEMPVVSDGEALFLKYICTEKSYVTIAETLDTSLETINRYRDSIYQKFEMNNRTNLALLAMQLGKAEIETK